MSGIFINGRNESFFDDSFRLLNGYRNEVLNKIDNKELYLSSKEVLEEIEENLLLKVKIFFKTNFENKLNGIIVKGYMGILILLTFMYFSFSLKIFTEFNLFCINNFTSIIFSYSLFTILLYRSNTKRRFVIKTYLEVLNKLEALDKILELNTDFDKIKNKNEVLKSIVTNKDLK